MHRLKLNWRAPPPADHSARICSSCRFAASTSAEIAAEDARTTAEGELFRRETERLELAARLASLAATVEHRTRGEGAWDIFMRLMFTLKVSAS